MHLISALAAGVRGAENGSVNLTLRGTSTAATYYADFEATQALPGTGVPLDPDGRLIAYVSALVDVVVHDSNGVDVCEFVAGSEDASVEVISPSFTGTDYTSGAIGTQKPTNLEAVLDGWITSAGAPNWQVLVNGAALNISALGVPFFNVRTYGAVGNGVADDRSAITSANLAATTAGGGIVFFPAGTYRVTSAVSLPGNVTWLGPGGLAAKLAVDSAAAQGAVLFGVGASGALASIIGMWIGAINGAVPGPLINSVAGGAGEVHITDCVLGNDALSNTFLYLDAGAPATFKVVFTRCYMRRTTGTDPLVGHYGPGRAILRDCTLVNTNATAGTMVDAFGNLFVEGCTFDWSTANAGTLRYLSIAPTASLPMAIVGNFFYGSGTLAGPVAIYHTAAVPQVDCLEYGNVFGGSLAAHTPSLTPYGYATDGYAGLSDGMMNPGGHGTRTSRVEVYTPLAGGAVTADPKAFGTTQIQKTGGGALTVNANKGSLGDRWTLEVINSTGVGLTVTAGTNVIFDPVVTAGTLVLAAAGFSHCTFQWLPDAGGTGHWYMTGKAVTS